MDPPDANELSGDPQPPVIRVLIVDDHVLVSEGTRRLIELEPDMRAIGIARDGAQALHLIDQDPPDVVLMDIEMPGMDGIQATTRIVADYPGVSVLVLSAYDDDEYVERLLEAGASGYMLKDARASQLIEAIRAVHGGDPVLHPAIARKVIRTLATTGAHTAAFNPDSISERELAVLRLIGRGMGNEAIALALGISARTVQAHLSNIFSKMQVDSRTQAVVEALRRQLITLEELGP